jgi:hypothetical protein
MRLSALKLFVVIEPLLCGPLSLIAALSAMITLFYVSAVAPPNFPVWLMLGIFLEFALLRVAYYLLIRLCSRRRKVNR